MAQTKILLDTNSYLRLAVNLHPLLFVTYGVEKHTLYVHKDLQDECARQPRLANKFDWINQPRFVENRKRSLSFSKAQKLEVEVNFDFMWGHVQSDDLSPSKIDTRILASALTLGVRVVNGEG